MARVISEIDYTVRFDDIRSKISNKTIEHIFGEPAEYSISPMRRLDKALYGYEALHGYRGPPKSKVNDVKFCISERGHYKLNNGWSISYKHKTHLDTDTKEQIAQRKKYNQDYIDANPDEFEMISKPSMWGGSDYSSKFRDPIEIIL